MHVAKMSFFCRLAGLILTNRERNLDIFCIERSQLRWIWSGSLLDVSMGRFFRHVHPGRDAVADQ